jgi:hypothetical protein
MYLSRLSVSVAVAPELLLRHPLVRLPLQKRLPLFVQCPLKLVPGTFQGQPVQLAGCASCFS